ncbi:MAG: Hsp20/alpha crystallin family protein [Bacteroidales bacterium]
MTLVRFRNSNCVPGRVDAFGLGQLANAFHNDYGQMARFGSFPPANIVETADDFRIELQVPGYGKEDIKIRIEDQILTVMAELGENEGSGDLRYARREFGRGSFSRRFRLSNWIDTQKIAAKYENGILIIEIPKREEIKSKPALDIEIN